MRRLIAGLGVLVVGVGAWTLLRLPRNHPPMFAPFRRQVRDPLTSAVRYATRFEPQGYKLIVNPPGRPKLDALPSVGVYKSAIAANKEHPGALAFHADTDLYCEYNKKAVEDQARKEGITVGEVKELTFFGFAAMRATQPEKLAEVLGHPLAPGDAQKLSELLERQNNSFLENLHRRVDDGATEAQRWALIRETEQRFMSEMESTFGVNEAQFDRMLAPDERETQASAAPVGGVPPGAPPVPALPAEEPPSAAPVNPGPPKPPSTLNPASGPSHMQGTPTPGTPAGTPAPGAPAPTAPGATSPGATTPGTTPGKP